MAMVPRRIGPGLAVLGAGFLLSGSTREGRVIAVDSALTEMVVVPRGAFAMGQPDDADEAIFLSEACATDYGDLADQMCPVERFSPSIPFRRVYLESFEIDRFEVTVAEYRRCVRAGVCDVAPLLFGDQRYNRSEWPVTNVTWLDARDYCAFRSKRLPTEAEWEKAARGTDGRRWPWGDVWRRDGSNHGALESNVIAKTHAMRVGDHPEPAPAAEDGFEVVAPPGGLVWGESPYGAYDMAGNVSEWVADFFSGTGYADLPTIDPYRSSPADLDKRRVVRGGSWFEPRLYGLTYDRNAMDPDWRGFHLGFRCARSVE